VVGAVVDLADDEEPEWREARVTLLAMEALGSQGR